MCIYLWKTEILGFNINDVQLNGKRGFFVESWFVTPDVGVNGGDGKI